MNYALKKLVEQKELEEILKLKGKIELPYAVSYFKRYSRV